jgi:hypothetical protein
MSTAISPVVAAGSAREAQRAAEEYVLGRHMAWPCIAGLPVPGTGPNGPAFSFLLAELDTSARELAVYEPQMAVAIDAASLEPVAYQQWRPAASRHDQALAYWFPEPVRRLPSVQVEALRQAMLLLTDELAPYAWEAAAVPTSAAEAVRRYDLLLRTLVPRELLPYYEKLDARFFGWLEASVSAFGRLDDTGADPLLALRPPDPAVVTP